MKSRILKAIRNTAISVGVLLVLFVGGGVAYTWYMGQTTEVVPAATVPVQSAPSNPAIDRPKPAPDAPASASVQMITSPVAPGENSSISVKTNPEAKCMISVTYDEVKSTDSGLKPKVADEYGIISWVWTVEPSVPLGVWPVEVTCAHGEKTAVVKAELIVE